MGLKPSYVRFFKKVSFAHNTLVLVSWLYVELLMVYHLYKHMHSGPKLDLNLLSTLNLWLHVQKEFKMATLFNLFNLLFLCNFTFTLTNSSDKKKHRKAFLSVLFHHLKALLLYFVTFTLLDDKMNPRWSLVNLTVWTLLNVLESLNSYNLYMDQKSEFVEWLYYKLFLFMYPLLCVSELMLLTSSYPFLKNFDKFKNFPSAMPNRYNFTFNLHTAYKFLPLPMALFSAVLYFNKCKNG